MNEHELTIERKGLQEMLSDLKWRDVKHIVVLNTSLLWRADIVKVLIAAGRGLGEGKRKKPTALVSPSVRKAHERSECGVLNDSLLHTL